MEQQIPKLPRQLPNTLSFFYMPLISHSYLIHKNLPIPPGLNAQIKSIKQLELLTDKLYDSLIEGIVYYLNNNIIFVNTILEPAYSNTNDQGDKYSKQIISDAGHIPGKLQEHILNTAHISRTAENLYTSKFHLIENKRIVKNIIDSIIEYHYAVDPEFKTMIYKTKGYKYYMYKMKYLVLKSKLQGVN